MVQLEQKIANNSQEAVVKEYFDEHAEDWHGVYVGKDITSRNMQTRLRYVCNFLDTIGLKKGTRVLDLGCGAGFASIQLLQRGYQVTGVDLSEKMLDLARKNCSDTGVGNITFQRGNAEQLDLEDASYDAVIALGVIEYTASDGRVLREMNRLLKPGGYLILSVPNRFCLYNINIPFNCMVNFNQLVRWIKKSSLKKGFPPRINRAYIPPRLRRRLSGYGFAILDSVSYGFGPFILLRNYERISIYLNQVLTQYSKKKLPILSELGNEYLFFCQKG